MALNPRVLIGKKGSAHVIECSQPGFDVLTCDPHEMLFSSQQDIGSVIETGSVTVTHNGSQSVAIDLGGVPMVTIEEISGSPARSTIPALFANGGFVWAEVDEDEIVFRNTSGASRTISYQITNREAP